MRRRKRKRMRSRKKKKKSRRFHTLFYQMHNVYDKHARFLYNCLYKM